MKLSILKKILLWFGLYLFLTLAVYVVSDVFFKPKAPKPQEAQLLIQVDEEKDWIKGPKSASITLVEYSDFQCPACQNYYPLIKKAEEQLGDKFRLVYRHYPLKDAHPQSEMMAVASEAAGKQGKFWEMHNLIFENVDKWQEKDNVRDVVLGFAKDLGLDMDKFGQDLDSEELVREVDGDLYGGIASGIKEAPTFFLNGKKVQLPTEEKELVEFLQK